MDGLGTSMPLAIPSNFSLGPLSYLSSNYCSASFPFRVQPIGFDSSICFQGNFQNNSFDVDVGFIAFSNCSQVMNYSSSLYPSKEHVFICGGNVAFTILPMNWTGLCVMATLLPDIDVISGNDPVPIPSFDYPTGRVKRAVQFIPLLVGLGISRALTTGSAGLGVAVHLYSKLPNQLTDGVQALSSTIIDI